ncbi:hypothetical protein NIES4071_72240 [Calothrix sp. NIES-4071]|nr:hypothetical protein NIES4071_72240 [Calothrix sp. NIES-4071]BAZ61499.1 hypothetical protein NIES4105_72190 [Calothrix sp. NIES-4105]
MKVEQLQDNLAKIERLQSTMIDVANHGFDIRDRDDLYQQLYQEVDLFIEILQEEGLSVSNPNNFQSLWEWYEYWSSEALKPYAREKYVYDLYLNIFNIIEDLLQDKSIDISIETLNILYFENLNKTIKQIQSILSNVATKESKVEDKEENYITIYKYISTQIKNLKALGIPINNPNYFRKLSYWKAYCLCELSTHQSRQEYIEKLYITITSSIEKAKKRTSLKDASVKEFLEYFKRYIIEAQLIQNPVVASKIPAENIQLIEQNTEATLFSFDSESRKPVTNSKSIEELSPPIFASTTQSSQSNSYDAIIDVVIITALEKERDAVLRYLDSPQLTQRFGKTFYTSVIKTLNSTIVYQVIIVCLEGMGNLKSSFATQKAITEINPSRIILVGIAGGVPKDGRYLGDIIVGEQILYYELGKQIQLERNIPQTQRRNEVYRPAKDLLDAAKSLNPQNWVFSIKAQRPDGSTGRVIPKVHFGVVASGDKVIADSSFREELQSDWSQLVGVEMESAGAASAAYESNFMQGIFLVKGMCDWADGSKNDVWQEYAAESSACFVVNLLKLAPFESKLKLNTQNSGSSVIDSKFIADVSNNQEPISSTIKISKNYSGRVKVRVCENLFPGWELLADYFDISPRERAAFQPGRQAHDVWDWLKQRDRLDELEDALREIGREEVVQELYK